MAETAAFNPAEADIKAIKKLIDEVAGTDTLLPAKRLFIEGDHWQGGTGWIGPWPPDTEVGAVQVRLEIQKGFTSQNVIGEVVDRHTEGVVGREPGWTVVPRRKVTEEAPVTPAEKTAIDEINGLLTEWWDARNIPGVLHTITERVAYAKRSLVRLYVPDGQAGAEGLVSAAEGEGREGVVVISTNDPAQAIMLVWPDTPLAEEAMVYVVPETKQPIGILAQEVDGKLSAEITYLQTAEAAAEGAAPGAAPATGPGGQPAAAFTVIRQMSEREGAQDTEVAVPLGGRLTMFEIARRPLITEQVMQQQKGLNLAHSMVPRNVTTGGFLERIITNGQIPGEWVENPANPEGPKIFKAFPWRAGAGGTAFLSGEEIEDDLGKVVKATPGVHFREPVPVTSSVDAVQSHYEAILSEVAQRHVLMGSDATASGVSREQARADFEKSLEKTATQVQALGRWLLETALALTEALTSQPGKWTNEYRVEFRVYTDTGPLSSDETLANNSSVEKGTLSRETAMAREGIIDVDAELQRIGEQEDARLALWEKRANVIVILAGEGMPLADIAELLKMEQWEMDIMKRVIITKPEPTGDENDGPTPGGFGGDDDPAAEE